MMKERERERDRQTDRQTERDRQRETERDHGSKSNTFYHTLVVRTHVTLSVQSICRSFVSEAENKRRRIKRIFFLFF